MYQTQGKVVDAVNLYSSILSQLGETIPESSNVEASTAMFTETLIMCEETFDEAWIQTKMEENKPITDWRTNVSTEKKETLKIQDGETKRIVFIDEGTLNVHPDFGESVKFSVEHNAIAMNWYVRGNNYSLLGQIKELGELTGMVADVSRTGAKKSDTRYSIEKVE